MCSLTSGVWYKFAAFVVRHIALRLTGGVRVFGAENVPLTGPVILAANHSSNIDPPLVGSVSPRQLRFMAKEEMFRGFIGWLVASLGAYPVRRGEADSSSIKKTIEWLKQGDAVLMFPEGTRGDGHQLRPMQPGLTMIAKRAGAVVVPVGIVGASDVLPRGASKPRRARVTVVFGMPIAFDAETDSKPNRAEFMQLLEKSIADATERGGRRVKTLSEASIPDGAPADQQLHEVR